MSSTTPRPPATHDKTPTRVSKDITRPPTSPPPSSPDSVATSAATGDRTMPSLEAPRPVHAAGTPAHTPTQTGPRRGLPSHVTPDGLEANGAPSKTWEVCAHGQQHEVDPRRKRLGIVYTVLAGLFILTFTIVAAVLAGLCSK
ncbi:hypothetical protein BJF96_g7453 [Verticillium dahliae]|uniref:Uncharacterized protein n=1 Tax=Verticillium dahliae TaxID=27337 RepID=A0A2J8BWY5_VERDA|nr:hypothetical protein BJF96_g7453 [Verticillium dahliae]PNH39291.1 hypothetical protein VD0003_g10196 [Verticillium dahliae]RXG45596.1 hypothetical protein VDGE_21756 [Verticillium dahliae]